MTYVLPAEGRDRQVIALRQISAAEVGGEEVIRPWSEMQIRFVDVAGCAGSPVGYEVGGQRLRSASEPGAFVAPSPEFPCLRRTRTSSRWSTRIRLRLPRQPFESQFSLLSIGVVRTPRGVSDDALLPVDHLRRLLERDAIFRQKDGGISQPFIAERSLPDSRRSSTTLPAFFAARERSISDFTDARSYAASRVTR